MPVAKSVSLETLLGDWKKLLSDWVNSGALTSAASEALQLKAEPGPLKTLVSQWSHGDFSGLPPIVLLPGSSMPGAAGAYAISTGTIYLNQDWLATASPVQAVAVLTEELGHHLDGLLNAVDTPGDEGELFAALLRGEGAISDQQRKRLLTENDQGIVLLNGKVLAVEQATVVSTPIPRNGPSRTDGEHRSNGAFAALRGDGSIVTWGNSSQNVVSGGSLVPPPPDQFQCHSNLFQFIGLRGAKRQWLRHHLG